MRLVHQSHLAKLALALAGLLLEDVALALFTAQYLARAGYLETLGDCLAGFIDTTLRVMVERDYRLFPNTQVFFMQIFSSDDGKWALPDHTLPGAFDAAGCIKK